MARTLGTLVVELLAKTGSFETDLKGAERAIDRTVENVAKSAARMGQVVGAALAGAATAIGAGVQNAINQADEIGKMAQKLSISTEALSGFAYAAKLADVELGSLQGAFVRLNRAQAAAGAGDKTATALFDALGVSIKDASGNMRALEPVLLDTVDALAKLQGRPEQLAAGTKIFGKAFADIVPFVNGGTASIAAAREELRAFGGEISQSQAAAAEAYNDNITRLQVAFNGVFLAVANDVLPTLVRLTEEMVDGSKEGGTLATTASGITQAFNVMLGAASGAADAIQGVATAAAAVVDLGSQLGETTGRFARISMGQAKPSDLAYFENYGARVLTGDDNAFGPLMDSFGNAEALQSPLVAVAAALEEVATQNRNVAGSSADAAAAAVNAALAAQREAAEKDKAARAAEAAARAAEQAARRREKAEEEVRKELERIARAQRDYGRDTERMAAQMRGPQSAALAAYRKGLDEVNDALAEQSATTQQAAARQRVLADAYKAAREEAEKQATAAYNAPRDNVAGTIGQLTDEVELLEAVTTGREDHIDAIRIEQEVRRVLAGLSDEERQKLEAEIDTVRKLIEERERLAQLQQAREGITSAVSGIFDGAITAVQGGTDAWTAFRQEGVRAISAIGQELPTMLRNTQDLSKDLKNLAVDVLPQLGQLAGVVLGGGGQGAAAGAAIGSAIGYAIGYAYGGPVGGAIGGAIGGIIGGAAGGAFDDDPSITVRSRPFGNQEQARASRLGALYVRTEEITDPSSLQVINDLIEFDNQIAQFLPAENLQAARARLANFSLTVNGSAAAIEDIMGARLNQVIATFGSDVVAFIDNFSTDLQARTQALFDIIQIDRATDRGRGLTDDLATTLLAINQFRDAAETVGAAFARLVATANVVEEAMNIANVAFDGSRLEFIAFAEAIADEVGGIEDLAELLTGALDVLYSDEEQRLARLEAARRNLTDELADVGLGAGASAADIRAGYEQALREGNSVAVREFLEAAQALGIVLELTGEAAEGATDRLGELRQFLDGIAEEVLDIGASDFRQELRGIDRDMREALAAARELGARTEDLGIIQLRAARRAAEAIRELQEEGRNLAAELYGTPLTAIEAEIARLEQSAQGAAYGVNTVSAGLAALSKEALTFRDNMLLDSSLSPLNVQQQFEEALDQLRATGDEGVGRRALELSRRLRASGADYTRDFNLITSLVRGGQGNVGGGGSGGGQPGDSPELIAARLERDRLLAEQEKLRRAGQARELAQVVADLALVQQESFGEIAADLGFSLEQLGADLGLSGDALSAFLTQLQKDPALEITAGDNAIIAALYDLFGPDGVVVDPETNQLGGESPTKPDSGGVRVPVDPIGAGKVAESSAPIVATLERIEATMGDLLSRLGEVTEGGVAATAEVAANVRRVQSAVEELGERVGMRA